MSQISGPATAPTQSALLRLPSRESYSEGERPRKSLSPSRANEFRQCPLLFRLRTIDKIPQPHSAAANRGTLVHAVLERLYDTPRGERTHPVAVDLVPSEWARMVTKDPSLPTLFADGGDAAGITEPQWFAQAATLLERYFQMEDPNQLEPAHRESWVSHKLDNGLVLHGVVDRIDRAEDGRIRIVDYKTGKAPRPAHEDKYLFQMQFYGYVFWQTTGTVPAMLQLLFLKDRQVLRNAPAPDELLGVERHANAIWAAIERAVETGNFPPRRSKLCDWCSYQAYCPLFGGTPPPFNAELARERLGLD